MLFNYKSNPNVRKSLRIYPLDILGIIYYILLCEKSDIFEIVFIEFVHICSVEYRNNLISVSLTTGQIDDDTSQ